MDANSTPKPAAPGGTPTTPDPTRIDLVAGTPPVPITVWRTARTGDEPGTAVTARLAARILIAYSRPGEAVVDLTNGHALTRACHRGGRVHHPAWFTDANLVVGPATDAPVQGSNAADDGGADPDPDVPDIGDWFGDDLTEDLPPHTTTPPATLDPHAPLAGNTSLVVAPWPLDASGVPNRVRLAFLLATCARLLRPDGCLVLVVTTPPGAPATPQDFSDVVDAAAACGLGYLQHIVAVTGAETCDDEFVYHATGADLAALSDDTARAAVHLRVHHDLLVFTQTGGDHHG